MKVVKTIAAGAAGTRKYLEVWGDMLLNVRYRETDDGALRVTTIELVVDERRRIQKGRNQLGYLATRAKMPVQVAVAFEESELRQQIKEQGGRWDAENKVWRLRRDKAIALGLKARFLPELVKK